jgi:hypothetical protein
LIPTDQGELIVVAECDSVSSGVHMVDYFNPKNTRFMPEELKSAYIQVVIVITTGNL